jgi:hypothetical protein
LRSGNCEYVRDVVIADGKQDDGRGRTTGAVRSRVIQDERKRSVGGDVTIRASCSRRGLCASHLHINDSPATRLDRKPVVVRVPDGIGRHILVDGHVEFGLAQHVAQRDDSRPVPDEARAPHGRGRIALKVVAVPASNACAAPLSGHKVSSQRNPVECICNGWIGAIR